MFDMRIKISDENGKTLGSSIHSADRTTLVYMAEYQKGDKIRLETNKKGYYFIKFDETMDETLIYVDDFEFGGLASFPVPLGNEKVCYSPKSFSGDCHVMSARKANEEEIKQYRNLAFNPYDRHNISGFFPHSHANVETRNEAVFASRNAIDGVCENLSHGGYPYSSWGINRDPNAALTIEFGRDVEVDKICVVLRADFPHDNYWTKGEVTFSDGSTEILNFEKTADKQVFTFEKRVVNSVVFGKLIRCTDDISPFPSLTQIEVYGKNI